MIKLKIFNFSIVFDFSFFAVIAIFLAFDHSGYGIYSIIACLLHEIGHLTAMLFEKTNITGIRFYGGGIKISVAQTVSKTQILSKTDDCFSYFVLLAGSGLNFILFGLFYLFSDKLSIFPLIFATMNLVIGAFNLLPIGYLDGKKILEKILIKRFSLNHISAGEKCFKILKNTERAVFLAVFSGTILFFLTNNVNFTLIIILAYIFILDKIRAAN